MNITHAARTSLVALAALLVSTFTVLGVTAAPADARTTSQIRAMSSGTYEQELQHYINQRRAARGLPRLRLQSCTDYLSERWSRHLADTGGFYHQSLDPFFNRCNARYAGETLAKGVIAPRTVVQLWMESDAHRRVMLSKSPRRLGVAAVLDSRGVWVVTANYTRF